MEPMIWARQQFWGAALCGLRLQRRLVEVEAVFGRIRVVHFPGPRESPRR